MWGKDWFTNKNTRVHGGKGERNDGPKETTGRINKKKVRQSGKVPRVDRSQPRRKNKSSCKNKKEVKIGGRVMQKHRKELKKRTLETVWDVV